MTMKLVPAVLAALAIGAAGMSSPAAAAKVDTRDGAKAETAIKLAARRGKGPARVGRRPGRIATPGINRRMRALTVRIRAMRRKGAIRPIRARRLMNRVGNVRFMLRRARRDGVVTFRERRRMHNRLDRIARTVRRSRRFG